MHTSKKPAGENAGAMEIVANGAVAISAGVAAIGVAGIVGWASTLAAIGSVALIATTVATEFAASRLPVQAESRMREGRRLVALAVVLGFVVLTAANVMAGHMGLAAINEAGVADKRRPLVEAAAATEAKRVTAEEALDAFDARVKAQDAELAGALRGAIERGFVTAGANAMRNGGQSREAERARLAEAVASARTADRRAQAALRAAATGRPDHELWAFALVLELLKGALVWFCTPRKQPVKAIDPAGVITIAPGAVRDMTEEQLREVLSKARSVSASAQHELRRRQQAAA